MSTDNLEQIRPARPLTVPYVPGRSDLLLPSKLISPPEDPFLKVPKPEKPTRRMWLAAGAVAVLATAICAEAFAQRNPGETSATACVVVAVSEPAENHVEFQLDRPAGGEKVWIGSDTSVMEAHRAASSTDYAVDMAGYFHNDIIGVYVGPNRCWNRFDLGTTQPGIKKFYAQ